MLEPERLYFQFVKTEPELSLIFWEPVLEPKLKLEFFKELDLELGTQFYLCMKMATGIFGKKDLVCGVW
jgi:hypothetical protein